MSDFETQKTIADKLSKLLPIEGEKGKGKALEMLKKLGYNNLLQPADVIDKNDSFPPGHIGIYKPETVNGEVIYNRDIDYIDRWTYFANTPTIHPKKDKKRIVFLGESVARGFLLEPDFTPALVLDKLLTSNSSKDEFEVIDLAESNISMRGIKNRFTQCLDLQPDLVVFLAGNNWYEDYFFELNNNSDSFKTINNAENNAENLAEIKIELESVLKNLTLDFLTFVSQKMKEHKVPVILAIPEFNLMDCRSTLGERRATCLSGDGIIKWSQALKKAQEVRSQADLKQVGVHAQQMIDIDPSHPLGYEILADVKIEQQDYEAARELLELGRDTAVFYRSNSKPRVFQVIRRTILEYAPKLGIEILDIPDVFKRHLKGKIPGKELFLDYCHFTVEGIQVAIEPLADQVLTLTQNKNKKVLQASSIRPSKLIEGTGHFYAAIHNAHWGQSYDILRHHCQKALEASKEVSKIMVYYCDMVTRNVSNNLTKSMELILNENIQVDRYGHAFAQPKGLEMMEIDLVNAMVDALEVEGVNLARFVRELRKKEHGVHEKSINLLKPFYHASSFDESLGIRPAFFQVRDTASRFFIVADEGVSINLFISFRVPSSESYVGKVEFWLNDFKVSSLDPQSKWINHEITISGEHCKDGINELIIFWPTPKAVERSISKEIGTFSSLLNTMYYVFGEISRFEAIGEKETVSQGENPVEIVSK